MKSILCISLIVLLPLISLLVHAETRYVTDEFQVMLRTGPSLQNKIIQVLNSGARIDVLREKAGNGHSQVQTGQGETGYVLTRFLSNQPSARSQLFTLEKQIEQLRSTPSELQRLLVNSQEENQQLIVQNVELTEKFQQMKDELSRIKEASSDAVKMVEENQRLGTESQQLLLQLDDVRIQNEVLKDQSAKRWFILGASAILLGLFLGWVLSMARATKRNAW